MSRAAEIVKNLLFELENMVKPGVTTLELDSYAENFITDQGAIPAFKGLYGFPGTLCVSINDEVVHGVPSNRELIDGDIIDPVFINEVIKKTSLIVIFLILKNKIMKYLLNI